MKVVWQDYSCKSEQSNGNTFQTWWLDILVNILTIFIHKNVLLFLYLNLSMKDQDKTLFQSWN